MLRPSHHVCICIKLACTIELCKLHFVTNDWNAKVEWMRTIGATSAAWHEGELVRCELGPVPFAPPANVTKHLEAQEPRKRLQATSGLVRGPIG